MVENILFVYCDFLSRFKHLFPLSSRVDLLLLLLDVKPCLRTKVKDYKNNEYLFNEWCDKLSLFHCVVFGDFFYLSKSRDILLNAQQIDHSPSPHEISFGYWMGYPPCCCEKIANVGEENIDAYEAALIYESFEGPFALINPIHYRKGKAFISHVPCSATCLPSLKQAEKLAHFLLSNRESPALADWIQELQETKREA